MTAGPPGRPTGIAPFVVQGGAGVGRLEGKHALVTGGSLGIGEAIARRFVEEGARVIVAARNEERGRSVVASLGPRARWHRLDVTDAAGWQLFADGPRDDPIDVLVNNAGELLYARSSSSSSPMSGGKRSTPT